MYHHHGPWRDRLFDDRPTCARSRLIIFRPEHGQPEVPFSWCRWHILDFHYRWGSVGPNETAITIFGGPRIISVFDVHGYHEVQRKHFFGMQIGSRTPSGLDPLFSRRLHRTRCCAGHAIALKVFTSPTSFSNLRRSFVLQVPRFLCNGERFQPSRPHQRREPREAPPAVLQLDSADPLMSSALITL